MAINYHVVDNDISSNSCGSFTSPLYVIRQQNFMTLPYLWLFIISDNLLTSHHHDYIVDILSSSFLQPSHAVDFDVLSVGAHQTLVNK